MLTDLQLKQNIKTFGIAKLDNLKVYKDDTLYKHFYEKNKVLVTTEGVKYYFKASTKDTYEHYAELVAYQVVKQLGLDCVEYHLAQYKGKIGVVSENFLSPDETLLTGQEMMADYYSKHTEEEFDILASNSIGEAKKLLKVYTSATRADVGAFVNSLLEHFFADTLTVNVDRGPQNWAIKKKGDNFSPAPIFDNARSFNLWLPKDKIKMQYLEFLKDNDKDDFEINAKNAKLYFNKLDSYYSGALRIENSNDYLYYNDKYIDDLKLFKERYPSKFNKMMKLVKNINITQAIKNVELETKRPMPKEVKHFIKLFAHVRKAKIVNTFNLKDDNLENNR